MSNNLDTTNLSYTQYLLKKQLVMSAQPDLPTDFEVIVIGTGLEESIVAAALARNGHNVLHIDTNGFYGDNWASFTFNGLQDWISSNSTNEKLSSDKKNIELDLKDVLNEGEKFHRLEPDCSVSDIKEQWFVSEEEEDIEKNDSKEISGEADDVNKVDNEDRETEKPSKDSTDAIDQQEKSDKVIDDDSDKELSNETDQKLGDVIANDEENEKPVDNEIPKNENASSSDRKSKWTKSKMIQDRNYNLDLMPRLLYCRGSMVELLIQSNISRYTEFKAVSRVLTILNGLIVHVPSSRQDVFATEHISVVQKRALMKFMELCLNYENDPEVLNYQDRPFVDFLKKRRLTENLIHFVMTSIAMVNKSTNTIDGLKATQKFLSSLGRFGSNTPFLYSSFGSGELPQAFCRLCAVFGGTYFLSRSIEGIITDVETNKCLGIISNGQKINCQKLVLPGKLCPDALKKFKTSESIYRKILLTCDSISKSEKEQLTFLSIPDPQNDTFTFVTEVGHGASVCPKSMYCLHLVSNQEKNLDENLEKIIEDVRLWSLDFKVSNNIFEKTENETLYLTSGPRFEVDYDQTIENAKNIYQSMFPEEPFLPRAPDPEEIILDFPNDESNVECEGPDVGRESIEEDTKNLEICGGDPENEIETDNQAEKNENQMENNS